MHIPHSPTDGFHHPNGWHLTASPGGCWPAVRTAVCGSVEAWLPLYLPQGLNPTVDEVYSEESVTAAIARSATLCAQPRRRTSINARSVNVAPRSTALHRRLGPGGEHFRAGSCGHRQPGADRNGVAQPAGGLRGGHPDADLLFWRGTCEDTGQAGTPWTPWNA